MFSTNGTMRAMLAIAFLSTEAAAQSATATDSTSTIAKLARRSTASISFIQSRPQGAFAQNVGLGYGVNGAYVLRLDDAGILGLRVDAGIATYGRESKRTNLSETVGGRVQVDVETSNYVVPLTVGPQLSWPTGALRPYVNAGIGGQGFFTESTVEGTTTNLPFASTTNHSAWTSAWSFGGGVAVPIHAGSTNVQLDLGAQYVAGSRARYLAQGSITDLPNGAISVTPLESVTHMTVVRLGVSVGR